MHIRRFAALLAIVVALGTSTRSTARAQAQPPVSPPPADESRPVPAQNAGAAPADPNVARLEALLEAQNRKIEQLEQRVAATSEQDMNSARADEMRRMMREIMSEQEFRESLMPATLQAGYDKGFFIRSTDEKFLLKVNGQMQFRYTYYNTRSENRYLLQNSQRDDRSGFDIQRTRIDVTGQAYSPDLTYRLTFRADAPDGYNARLHYAYANYRFSDAFQVRTGIFRLASTRAQMRSDADFQFIDRPMTDAVFGLGIGAGVRLWGQLCQKRVEWFMDVVNSLGSSTNRTITVDPPELDGNPAILAKVIWHALGDDPPNDLLCDADLEYHTSPALDFGAHYAFEDDRYDLGTLRIPFPRHTFFLPGGFGLTTSNGLQVNQFGFDAAFKLCGFSMTAEYILRLLDPRHADRPPFTPLTIFTNEGSTVAQHGAYVQAGYFLPIPGFERKIELAARVGGVSTLAEGREGTWEYSGGVNYYIEGNRVKLQTDVTRVYEVPISNSFSSLANVNDDALVFRVQLQFCF